MSENNPVRRWVNAISPETYLSLRAAVGFHVYSVEQAARVLAGSTHLEALEMDGRIVAMARLLFDFGQDAYVTDVIVLPECQGQGVGRELMARLCDFVRPYAAPDAPISMSLYASQAHEVFYERLGFSRLPNKRYGAGLLRKVHVDAEPGAR